MDGFLRMDSFIRNVDGSLYSLSLCMASPLFPLNSAVCTAVNVAGMLLCHLSHDERCQADERRF